MKRGIYVLMFVLVFSMSFASAGLFDFLKKKEIITITGDVIESPLDSTPRISYWQGKVNQHTENGLWMSDKDGVSGAELVDTESERIEYCKKFYGEGIVSSPEYSTETITFCDRGNYNCIYESTRTTYECSTEEIVDLDLEGLSFESDPLTHKIVDGEDLKIIFNLAERHEGLTFEASLEVFDRLGNKVDGCSVMVYSSLGEISCGVDDFPEPGEYIFVARVDESNLIEESNEENNYYRKISFVGIKPTTENECSDSDGENIMNQGYVKHVSSVFQPDPSYFELISDSSGILFLADSYEVKVKEGGIYNYRGVEFFVTRIESNFYNTGEDMIELKTLGVRDNCFSDDYLIEGSCVSGEANAGHLEEISTLLFISSEQINQEGIANVFSYCENGCNSGRCLEESLSSCEGLTGWEYASCYCDIVIPEGVASMALCQEANSCYGLSCDIEGCQGKIGCVPGEQKSYCVNGDCLIYEDDEIVLRDMYVGIRLNGENWELYFYGPEKINYNGIYFNNSQSDEFFVMVSDYSLYVKDFVFTLAVDEKGKSFLKFNYDFNDHYTEGESYSVCSARGHCVLYKGDTLLLGDEYEFSIYGMNSERVSFVFEGDITGSIGEGESMNFFQDGEGRYMKITLNELFYSSEIGGSSSVKFFVESIVEGDEDDSGDAGPLVCDSGCILDDKCLPYGYRKAGVYCALGGELVNQSQEGATCDNNFECDSNVCAGGECVSGNIIQKAINFFKRIFGIQDVEGEAVEVDDSSDEEEAPNEEVFPNEEEFIAKEDRLVKVDGNERTVDQGIWGCANLDGERKLMTEKEFNSAVDSYDYASFVSGVDEESCLSEEKILIEETTYNSGGNELIADYGDRIRCGCSKGADGGYAWGASCSLKTPHRELGNKPVGDCNDCCGVAN